MKTIEKKSVRSIALISSLFLLSGCLNMSNDTKKEITTESGLKYEVIQEPKSGAQSPQKGQKVTVHYTGWLEENGAPGKKFDSSVDRGTPFTFNSGVGQVIDGWEEGVSSMKVGEKRRLYIPSDLGYGDRGVPGHIPGGATLIFDVELLAV